jgi:hypothetical protein
LDINEMKILKHDFLGKYGMYSIRGHVEVQTNLA